MDAVRVSDLIFILGYFTSIFFIVGMVLIAAYLHIPRRIKNKICLLTYQGFVISLAFVILTGTMFKKRKKVTYKESPYEER